MRLEELAMVYRAYEEELARRGALDFGEQIAAVTKLSKTRPNVLRHWQRGYRYLLIDEFQDANVAQIELIEAQMAGLDRLVFHTGTVGGGAPLAEALRVLREDLSGASMATTDVIAHIDSMAFQWGHSDGN